VDASHAGPRKFGWRLLEIIKLDVSSGWLIERANHNHTWATAIVGGSYLVKPFSARELMARVRAHLELARQRRELERELEQRVQARTAEVALVSTIIGLTHAFDMPTVAEGVDNQSQLDYLVREGCDESQGLPAQPTAAQIGI
jgi:DNA-binding response OmpR family regulator